MRDAVSGELALWLETVNVCHFYNMSFLCCTEKDNSRSRPGARCTKVGAGIRPGYLGYPGSTEPDPVV